MIIKIIMSYIKVTIYLLYINYYTDTKKNTHHCVKSLCSESKMMELHNLKTYISGIKLGKLNMCCACIKYMS